MKPLIVTLVAAAVCLFVVPRAHAGHDFFASPSVAASTSIDVSTATAIGQSQAGNRLYLNWLNRGDGYYDAGPRGPVRRFFANGGLFRRGR